MKNGELLAGSVASRIVSRLEAEGGWHGTSAVAALVGCDEPSVRRTLYRLHKKGMVVSRLVGVAPTMKNEWRAP